MEKFQSQEGRFDGNGEERQPLTGQNYERNDSPGADSFDDGLGADGKLKMPGSTVHESAPNYPEHKGPNDLVHREGGLASVIGELDPEITISNELPSLRDDMAGDAADVWLKANDPERGLNN